MEMHVELTLIAACQQGDPDAFRQIYDLHRDRIFALCRHMSGNLEDAADLTQEAFVDAFKGIQRFRAESSFGTWLYRIAVNRCLKAARRGRPESRSFDDEDETIVPIESKSSWSARKPDTELPKTTEPCLH